MTASDLRSADDDSLMHGAPAYSARGHRAPGRPRSAAADRAILDAALTALARAGKVDLRVYQEELATRLATRTTAEVVHATVAPTAMALATSAPERIPPETMSWTFRC